MKVFRKSPLDILAPVFGPIGDALMVLALFDEILTLDSAASFTIITRYNAGLIRDLARSYPSIEVLEIPSGLAAISFYLSLLFQHRTLIVLGVAEYYSRRLKTFFFLFGLIGNRTIGIADRSARGGWLPLHIKIPLGPSLPTEDGCDPSISTIDQFRQTLPYLGFDAVGTARTPQVTLQKERPRQFPFAPGHYIAAHLFASSPWRSFPPHRWKVLLAEIAREYPDLSIVLTGAEKDRALAQEIAAVVSGSRVCIDLPILEVAWIVDNAALYIGVDTGITHLAGVLQQKSVVMSHCGDLSWRPLYNENARVLANSRHCTCWTGVCDIFEDGHQYRRCLYDITDEALLSAVRLALTSPKKHVTGFPGWHDEHLVHASRSGETVDIPSVPSSG